MPYQVLKFIIVGVLATLTHIFVVIALVEALYASLYLANVVAWMSALMLSYAGHRQWTFASKLKGEAHHGLRLPRFIMTSLVGLLLNISIVVILHEGFGCHYFLATAAGVSLSAFITFCFARLWVFARP